MCAVLMFILFNVLDRSAVIKVANQNEGCVLLSEYIIYVRQHLQVVQTAEDKMSQRNRKPKWVIIDGKYKNPNRIPKIIPM